MEIRHRETMWKPHLPLQDRLGKDTNLVQNVQVALHMVAALTHSVIRSSRIEGFKASIRSCLIDLYWYLCLC